MGAWRSPKEMPRCSQGPWCPQGLEKMCPHCCEMQLYRVATSEKIEFVFYLLMENTVSTWFSFFVLYFHIPSLFWVYILRNFLCCMKKIFIKVLHLVLQYFLFVCSFKSHLFLPLWQLCLFTKAAMLPHERCFFNGCRLHLPLTAEPHPSHYAIVGQCIELMWHIERFLWLVHLLESLNCKERTYNFPELYFILSTQTVLASRN